MKIALFTDCFLPQINGVVTATVMLATELVRQGHEVHVIAPSYDEDDRDEGFPFPVVRARAIPAPFYEDFKWVVRRNPALWKYLKSHDFDIVHFQTPMPLGRLAIRLARRRRIPLVGTFHTFFADPAYLRHVRLEFGLVQRIGWLYSNYFYNACDTVTVPSVQTGTELKTHGCRRPIEHISNGMDMTQFDNTRSAEWPRTWGFAPGDIPFLFVGRMAHEKNIGSLIRGFAELASRDSRMKLVLVGGGPQEEEYHALASRLGGDRWCVFQGKMEHGDLVRSGIYGACRFFITLSRTENQPVTILEAQANGLIPVCLPEKGLKTMIEHGRTGWFLEGEDPVQVAAGLQALVADSDARARLEEGIRHSMTEQSMETIVRQWEELYQSLERRNHRRKGHGPRR